MSSQQWKLQSGASRSRNVKATSVLFERSNFWQRGSNLELYHDNDGSTTIVGVGTTLHSFPGTLLHNHIIKTNLTINLLNTSLLNF